jgi:hypothetical protein
LCGCMLGGASAMVQVSWLKQHPSPIILCPGALGTPLLACALSASAAIRSTAPKIPQKHQKLDMHADGTGCCWHHAIQMHIQACELRCNKSTIEL